MTITSDGVGQTTVFLFSEGGRPDGLVVVQEVREMILNEIFPRDTQVQGVPIVKLPTKLPG